jgi:23S rRNA pseudouridine2605 synthase
MAEERLQKIIAAAGIASRRKAEELIVTGHVSVNGVTITELGSKADVAVDDIKVDGHRLSTPKNHLYIALNKPKNVVTTVHDPQGRETVMQFFKGFRERIYPVGRLDYASEGLILLTNDGEFAAKLMSPSSHVTKTYLVKANGILTSDQEEQFRRGIPMHGRRTAPAGLKLIKRNVNPWYEVRLVEGRQNQIRIMFKHFGRLVEKLKRIKVGFLDLGTLKPGAYRTLTSSEVERFQRLLNTPKSTEVVQEHTQHLTVPRPALARPTASSRSSTPPLAGARRPYVFRDAEPSDESVADSRPFAQTRPFGARKGPTNSQERSSAPPRAEGVRRPFGPRGTAPSDNSSLPTRPFGQRRSSGPRKDSGPTRPAGPQKWSGSKNSEGSKRKPFGGQKPPRSPQTKWTGPSNRGASDRPAGKRPAMKRTGSRKPDTRS